jgi:hypothetical protein
MRPKLSMRETRRLQVAAGALTLLVPGAAAALATVPAAAHAPAAQAPLRIALDRSAVPYGHRVTVTGSAPGADRGRTLLLEFAPAGTSAWRTLGAAKVHTDGAFRVAGALPQSGSVRVFEAPVAGPAASRDQAATTGPASSVPRAVTVLSRLVPAQGAFGGGSITGTLLPRQPGRVIRLDVATGHGWRTVRTARTAANGHFTLAPPPAGAGVVRVSFAGDRLSSGQATAAHQLVQFHQSVASWYDDSGATACGFHAGLGVANKTLPCGTKVTFRYGGRTVTATVDDRGPFVAGRDWDLNQNTAAALGMDGVVTLDSSV